MNKNKLNKILNKHYWSHSQRLVIDTWEMFQNDERDNMFEVVLTDDDISLFTIQNYNGFRDCEFINKSYFKKDKYKMVETWDGVLASCQPRYFDGMITLYTFKPITKVDIIKATEYYIHEVLQLWGFFNIKFREEESKQLEFDFTKKIYHDVTCNCYDCRAGISLKGKD